MLNYYEIFVDYIFNNLLSIDKGTYLSTVIGQITVYALLLAFYQFIVSFPSTKEGSNLRYLGRDLINYYVNKRMPILKVIVSNPLFGVLFILEIIYKPIITIYGNYIPEKYIAFGNFCWYTYVVVFCLLFTIVIFQGVRCTLEVKDVSDVKNNKYIIRCINNDFRRRETKSKKKTRIDILDEEFKLLKYYISNDNNVDLVNEYNILVEDILFTYIINKEKDIDSFVREVQEEWMYIMNREGELLRGLLDEKRELFGRNGKNVIIKIMLKMLELNMRLAIKEGYVKINLDYFDSDKEALNCYEWRKLAEAFFEEDNNKKELMEILYKGYFSDNILYREYCKYMISQFIEVETRAVFEDKREVKEYEYVFGYILKNENINYDFSGKICENLITYPEANVAGLIELVKPENSALVFTYQIIYYSIYKFRFDWKYININNLYKVFEKEIEFKTQADAVNKYWKRTNYSHRYSDDIYTELIKNFSKEINGKWLEEIYHQELIDPFYITVIKLCVLKQKYYAYYNTGGDAEKIKFINELAKHTELMMSDKIRAMVEILQFYDFAKWDDIPEVLEINLGTLILTNIDISKEILSKKISYRYEKCIGKYLLIKLHKEMSDIEREVIYKAFIASNMSVEKYVENLCMECQLCGLDIGYVQKEKMKNIVLNML